MTSDALAMRSTVTKTSLASKILPKSLTTRSLATPTLLPKSVDFPDQESSQKSQSSKNSGQKKSWYQSKYFKYPLYAAGAGAIGITSLANHMINFIEKSCLLFSDNTQTADPELYKVFLEICKRYGIPEGDVFLYILHNPENERFGLLASTIGARAYRQAYFMYNRSDAFCMPHSNNIFIRDTALLNSKPLIISILAHELEHHRQFNEYFGSYKPPYETIKTPMAVKLLARGLYPETALKLEAGADAAMAGFHSCPDCLKAPKEYALSISYHPTILAGSHFNSKTGYFAPEDFDEYIENAQRDCLQCKAHETRTHDAPNTPLSHFLPPMVKP